MDKLRALSAYSEARGVTDRAAATANYLTPLTELAEKGQDALHDLNRGVRTAMADALTSAGVPPVLVGAATLPSHVFDSVVDFDAGVAKGVVQLADGLAGMVAHPVQTVQGVAGLIDRAAQATPQGRAVELLFETAYGKYDTPQELLAAYQYRTNPLSVAKAQMELARTSAAACSRSRSSRGTRQVRRSSGDRPRPEHRHALRGRHGRQRRQAPGRGGGG
jgi:hypothetical protein